MKIISVGKLPQEKVYKFRCANCNTVAEAMAREGRPSADQRDGYVIAFSCPVCSKDVWVTA